jgi:hypothetical protein
VVRAALEKTTGLPQETFKTWSIALPETVYENMCAAEKKLAWSLGFDIETKPGLRIQVWEAWTQWILLQTRANDQGAGRRDVNHAQRKTNPQKAPWAAAPDTQRAEIFEGIRQDRQSTSVGSLRGILSDQSRPECELRNEAVTPENPGTS